MEFNNYCQLVRILESPSLKSFEVGFAAAGYHVFILTRYEHGEDILPSPLFYVNHFEQKKSASPMTTFASYHPEMKESWELLSVSAFSRREDAIWNYQMLQRACLL